MPIVNDKYELIFERPVKDINSRAFLLKHKKSGARLFILSNDDDNKVFYIGFRTPPEDSTGVAHIMEHSTLCGSEKFPLKDPFVELAKGSLNTFLNAMTYPDKTVYPVASRNKKDFRNLEDVYLDAVFHPNIYKHPEILKQEGWSIKIESPEEPLTYNGVVYNEMKGVFSSPDDVLMRETFNTLFPDTTYGVESGGDPEYIPDLTYEQFINFHKRYYHPSNSYIYLYGDIDIEEQLSWLDEAYLSEYDAISIDSAIKVQAPFEKMIETEKYYPISDEESEDEKTYLSYNCVCGTCMDVKAATAMELITYALFGTQGAPVRQRLLDAGIGKDILPLYDSELLQPYFSVAAKDADASQKEEFLSIIFDEIGKAVKEGINKKSLKASLNSQKFRYKEADFGLYPKGLVYGLTALDGWLYDDLQPLLYLELDSIFDELDAAIGTDYYENLAREFLLENPHSSMVTLLPKKGLTEENEKKTAEKLEKIKNSLSADEIDRLIKETKALEAYQEEPSSPEALETIPLLSREDIERTCEDYKNEVINIKGKDLIWHDYNTNGIAYYSLLFDASGITKELFPYYGLLKNIISFVDTDHFTFSELNDEINSVTGGISFETGIYGRKDDRRKILMLPCLSVRTLYENIDSSFDLAEEVLFTGKYSDKKRLYEIIAELKSQLQMYLMSSGHSAAAQRAASYHSELSLLKEYMGGIEFYKFVEDLEKNFEARSAQLIENIEKVIKIIIRNDGLLVSVTADKEGLEKIKERLEKFIDRLEVYSPGEENAVPVRERFYDIDGNGFVPENKNEAFTTSGMVNYVSRAGRYIDDSSEFSGAVNVFHTIMRYEYMWFNIRVQGGAYGCMCSSNMSGDTCFVTYRDPHVKRSNDVFEGIPDYLESFNLSEREMTKYVIGTMSNADAPLTPAGKGSRDLSVYLCGGTQEDRLRTRNEIIDCSVEDIKALAPKFRKALEQNNICCIGCESKIEEDKALFKTVRNLFE